MEARSRRQYLSGIESGRSHTLSSDSGIADVSRGATRNDIVLDGPAVGGDRMTHRVPEDDEFVYADEVELEFQRGTSKRDKETSFKQSRS